MTDTYMLPPTAITGELQFFWIENNGSIHNLTKFTSPNLFVQAGSVGLGDAEFEIESDKLPSGAGSLIRKINTSARNMTVPIVVNSETLGELYAAAEDLHDWFDTGDEVEKRPGVLRIVRPDNTVRQISSYYLRGLEGDTGEGGPNWAQYPIELFCPDPYPTEPNNTVVQKNAAAATSFAIINQGRLEAFPIFHIDGPFNNFVIKNVTRSIELGVDVQIVGTTSLTTGQFLTIDTRPSEIRPGFSVYDMNNTNLINVISPASVFWSLKPGSNTIQITFSSGTTASTGVTITYLARYRSLMR